jgi:FkbM family methyltransferase
MTMIDSLLALLRKVRVAITPRHWLLKTRLSNGAVVYGKNRAGFGGRGIYVLRDAIEPEFEHLEDFLGSEGVFVDVGANTGIYTIKAAQHYRRHGGKGTVLAIEPFPDILATLHHSIQANGFTNVRLRNCCAGETTTSSWLWLNSGKPHEFSLLQHDSSAKRLSTLVVALDDLLQWEHLTTMNYLKIDAEGAETLVLKGAKHSIATSRPIIQAEITINAVEFALSNYYTFQAPNSPNHLFIPVEHPKLNVAQRLGWKQLS